MFKISKILLFVLMAAGLGLIHGPDWARAANDICGDTVCSEGYFCSPETITCVEDPTYNGSKICAQTNCKPDEVCNPQTGACEKQAAGMCCLNSGAITECVKKDSSASGCAAGRQEVNCNLYPNICPTQSQTASSPGEEVKFQPTVPSLLINIPGFKGFTNQGLTGADAEGYIYPPFIGQYVGAIYKWALLMGALVATIMILYGGLRYLMSGGNSGQIEEAKSRITSALLGLFLLLGSYTLLYLINPGLVRFENLKIQAIKPEFVGTEESVLSDEDLPAGQAVSNIPDLTDVPKTNLIDPRGNKARGDVVAALQKAVEEYDGPVSVNEGARTAIDQWKLVKKYCVCQDESQLPADVPAGQWQNYCTALKNCRASYKKLGRQGGNFTLTSTAGHAVGNAIDINATGGSYVGCQTVSGEEQQSQGVVHAANLKVGNPCIPKKQQMLIKAMIRAGFCVGLKSGSTIRESWHFELTTNGVPLSPFCTKDLNDANLQKLYYLQNEQ